MSGETAEQSGTAVEQPARSIQSPRGFSRAPLALALWSAGGLLFGMGWGAPREASIYFVALTGCLLLATAVTVDGQRGDGNGDGDSDGSADRRDPWERIGPVLFAGPVLALAMALDLGGLAVREPTAVPGDGIRGALGYLAPAGVWMCASGLALLTLWVLIAARSARVGAGWVALGVVWVPPLFALSVGWAGATAETAWPTWGDSLVSASPLGWAWLSVLRGAGPHSEVWVSPLPTLAASVVLVLWRRRPIGRRSMTRAALVWLAALSIAPDASASERRTFLATLRVEGPVERVELAMGRDSLVFEPGLQPGETQTFRVPVPAPSAEVRDFLGRPEMSWQGTGTVVFEGWGSEAATQSFASLALRSLPPPAPEPGRVELAPGGLLLMLAGVVLAARLWRPESRGRALACLLGSSAVAFVPGLATAFVPPGAGSVLDLEVRPVGDDAPEESGETLDLVTSAAVGEARFDPRRAWVETRPAEVDLTLSVQAEVDHSSSPLRWRAQASGAVILVRGPSLDRGPMDPAGSPGSQRTLGELRDPALWAPGWGESWLREADGRWRSWDDSAGVFRDARTSAPVGWPAWVVSGLPAGRRVVVSRSGVRWPGLDWCRVLL